MFEGVVSSVLLKVLGDYIQNLDSTSLNIGILSGKVELRNLNLKPTALDAFDLPVTVVKGMVGYINAEIPWKSLGSSPVVARVSDVFLVVQPKKCNTWDPVIEQQRFASTQKSKISSYEAQLKKELEEKKQSEKDDKQDEKKKDDGFVSRLTETVINNLQVHIENVHIRYEDTSDPDPAQAIIFGISLKALHAVSCDENWVPAFIKKAGVELKKKVELIDFCVYLINTMHNEEDKFPTTLLSSVQSNTAFQTIMLQTVSNVKTKEMQSDVILGPIDGTLKLVIQKEAEELDLSKPKIAAELELGSVNLTLHQNQYRSLLRTLDYMSNYQKLERFRKWRPAIRPLDQPKDAETGKKQWWRFALKSASNTLDKKYFTWDKVKERRAQREEYITLFKKKKKLDKYEQQKKQKLEVDMDTNLLIFSREIAEAELRLVEEQKKKKKKEQPPQEKPKSSGGWFSGWYGGSKKTEEQDDDDTNDLEITEEQRQFLYSTIGYDAQAKVEKAKLPDNYEKIKIKFSLLGGVIKLNDSIQTIISAEYSDLRTAITLREGAGNVLVGIGLHSFTIKDEFCKDTKYPAILYKRTRKTESSSRLVDISVETAPLHGRSDLEVNVALGKTDIVFNIPLLQKILSFFIIPSSVNLQFIEQAAKKQLNNIQQQALTQLRMALEDKKVLDVSVDIRAPRLIIPKDCSDESSEIILVDLGKFRLKSDIDREARKQRIKEEKVEEKDFYDRFDFDLNDIQVLLVPDKNALSIKEQVESNPLLQKVSIGMQLSNCITNHPTYPATKIEGKIPKVELIFSPKKFDTIMFTVYKVLDLVDNPTGTASAKLSKKGAMKVRQICADKHDEIKNLAVSDTFKDFTAELRQDGRLLLYDPTVVVTKGRKKPVACVTLTTHTIKMMNGLDSKLESVTDQDIVLRLPQADKTVGEIFVVLRPEADKEIWKEKLSDTLLTYASYDIVKPALHLGTSAETPVAEIGALQGKTNNTKLKLNLILEQFVVLVNFADPGKKTTTAELPLAKFHLSTLTIDLVGRKFDQELTLKLRTLGVKYLVQNVDRDILHSTGNDQTGDIAEIKLTLCTHEHSEHYSLNADTCLGMKFATFNLFFDPLALSKFVLFGYALMDVMQANSSKNSRMLTIKAELPPAEHHNHHRTSANRKSIRIDTNMNEISLILQDSGTVFASMSMRDTAVFFTSGDDGMLVDGEVGNLVAEDRGDDTQYKEILGLGKVGNSVVKFSFESTTKEAKGDLEYGKMLRITMESVKFIYLNKFIGKLQLYFVDGPLMDALKEGGRRIQKIAAEEAKKQIATSEASSMLGLDLTFQTPIVFVPVSQKSGDFVHADLGKIRVFNVLSRTDKCLIEDIRIELHNMNMKTMLNHISKPVVDSVNIDMSVKRVVSGSDGSSPNVDFSMKVSEVSMKLSHLQYQMIFRILDENIGDSAAKKVPQKIKDLPSELAPDHKETDSLGVKTTEVLKNLVTVDFPHLNLTIFRGSGDDFGKPDPIARMNMYDLSVVVKSYEGATHTKVKLRSVDAYDMRSDSTSHFKQFIDSETQNTDFLELDIESKSMQEVDKTYVYVVMGNPRIIFEPQVVAEIQQFFTDMRQIKKIAAIAPKSEVDQEEKGDIRITTNTWLGNDITLTAERKLFISRSTPGEVVIDGDGHTINLTTGSYLNPDVDKKLIHVSSGVKLRFRNITLRLSSHDILEDCIQLDENSVLIAPSTQGVFRESYDPLEVQEEVKPNAEAPVAKEAKKQKQIIMLKLGEPSVVFPVDATNANTHLFLVRANLNMNMNFDELGKSIELNVGGLTAYTETSSGQSEKIVGAPILEPIDMKVNMKDDLKDSLREIKASIRGVLKARLAYQDVKMITQIVNAFKSTDVKTKTQDLSKEEAIELALKQDNNAEENTEDDHLSDRSDEGSMDDDDEFEEIDETPTPVTPSVVTSFSEKTDETTSSKALDITGQFSVNRFDDKDTSATDASQMDEPQPVEKKDEMRQIFLIDPDQQLSILIVDDLRGYDIPLMNFVLSELTLKKGFLAQGGLNIGVTVSFCLYASYYNMGLADWEPIIEPWRAQVEFNRRESTEVPGKPTDEISIRDIAKGNETEMGTPLNFNFTQSMIRSVITTSQLWKDEFSGKSVSRKVDPYIIRNHSGFTIRMQKQNQVGEIVTLPHRKEYGFDFGKHSYKSDSDDNESIVLSFPDLGGLQRTVNVRVSTQTTFQSKEGLIGMIDVELKEGRKVITVRSGIKVRNNSTKTWLVGSGNLKEQNLVVIGELKPGEDVGVPMNAVLNGTLCLRPKGENKESPFWWSAAMNGFKFTELMLMENRSRPVECRHKDQTKSDLFCAVIRPVFTKPMNMNLAQIIKNDVTKEKSHLLQQRNCIIEIRAPLCVENLFGCDMLLSIREKDKLDSNESKLLHKGEQRLVKAGQKIHLYRASMRSHILLKAFPANNGTWKSRTSALIYLNPAAMKTSKDRIPVASQWPIIDEKGNVLKIHFDYSRSQGTAFREVMIYVPYWIMNHTQQSLLIRELKATSAGQEQSVQPSLTDELKVPKTEEELKLDQYQKDLLMFSFAHDTSADQGGPKLSIKINDTPHSEFFSVENVGISGNLSLTSKTKRYPIGFSTALCPGKFNRTKLVTFYPRYVVVNETGKEIILKQSNLKNAKEFSIKPKERAPYYWEELEATEPNLVCRVADTNYTWSAPFGLNKLDEMSIKMNKKTTTNSSNEIEVPAGYILNVNINEQKGCILVTLREPTDPPYLIDNELDCDLVVNQTNVPKYWKIPTASKVAYAWDNLIGTQKLVLQFANYPPKELDINEVKENIRWELQNQKDRSIRVVHVSVKARGTTRVIHIADAKSKDKSKAIEKEEFIFFLSTALSGIGLSVIDNYPREICYVFMSDIAFRYETTDSNMYLEFKCLSLQIDNTLRDATFPVAFSPVNKHSYDANDKNALAKPFLHFSMCKSLGLSDESVNMFRYVSVNLQEAMIQIDYAFIENVINVVDDLTADDEASTKFLESSASVIVDKDIQAVNTMLAEVADTPNTSSNTKFYFETLELHPIKVHLTFRFNTSAEDESDMDDSQSLKGRLYNLLKSLGFLTNIDEAPICLNPLILEHPLMTREALQDRITKHYTRCGTYELYKIVGSLELIGNPVGLFNDLTTGVKDLFYEPASSITKSPEEFSRGLARGSLSMLTHSIHGTFNTASKITGTIGKGLSVLTLDESYVKQRERNQTRKARGVREGLLDGTEALAKGIFEGATGVFTQPVKGAKQEGVLGVFKGFGKGIIGIPTKPLSGLVDFAAKTTEGISNIGTTHHERIRKPRTFRNDGLLLPYSEQDAFAADILHYLNDGSYMRKSNHISATSMIEPERPVFYMPDEDGSGIYLLTNRAVMRVKLSSKNILWIVELKQIQSCQGSDEISIKSKDNKEQKVRYKDKTYLMKFKTQLNLLVNTQNVK